MAVLDQTSAHDEFYNIIIIALTEEPVTISTESGNVVLISEDDLDRSKETLYLLSDPIFLEDVRNAVMRRIRISYFGID